MTVLLAARPHSDLNWTEELEKALQMEKITWEFDLGLHAPLFPLEEELRFQANAYALKFFTKEIWPKTSEKTSQAILYRGSADFHSFFLWSEKQEENWNLWKKERPQGNEAHLKRLFCAEAFIAYFQMLAHQLPDELPLILHLNREGTGTVAESLQLFSTERFEHFILEGISRPSANVGVCIPPDEKCSGAVLDRIDQFLKNLTAPYKPVYETHLTEQWDGLDSLYILPDALTPQGKRKLMGFQAAGGTVMEI